MKEYVCITDGVWWHNSLWNKGHTVIFPKKPNAHFISIEKGKVGLMDYAFKTFDGYELDQNLSQYEMIEIIADLNAINKNRQRERIRIEQRADRREKADRLSAFIEQGASVQT